MLAAIGNVKNLADDDLLDGLSGLVRKSDETLADLLVFLGEVDTRKLYAAHACSSMFAYCLELGMSEGSAYTRIRAARAARDFPLLLERLANSRLHLAGICLLAPCLTPDNHCDLIEAACGLGKRNIQAMLADRFPKSDVPEGIRKLPSPTGNKHRAGPASAMPAHSAQAALRVGQGQNRAELLEPVEKPAVSPVPGPTPSGGADSARAASAGGIPRPDSAAGQNGAGQNGAGGQPRPQPRLRPRPLPSSQPPSSKDCIEPLGRERYKVQFTARGSTVEKLRRVRDLLSHRQPNASLSDVIDQALTELRDRLIKERFATPPARRRAETPTPEAPVPKAAPAPAPASAPASASQAVPVPVVASSQPRSRVKAENGPHDAAQANAPSSVSGRRKQPTKVRGDATPRQSASGKTRAKRPSRHIPNKVKRAVFQRDGLRCTFVDESGKRCEETRFLEFHHHRPYGKHGPPTAENLSLRCRTHNLHAARADYGEAHIEAKIRARKRAQSGDESDREPVPDG